mgnify:CR=1 FL=1
MYNFPLLYLLISVFLLECQAMEDFNFNIEGKVCIITGAGRGLGREISMRFAQSGCRTAILSRTSTELESLAAEMEKIGSEALAFKADVTDSGEVRKVVDSVVNEYGTVDILVNNAAVNIRKPLIEYSDEEWHSILSTNLTGYFYFAREVGKIMIARRSGKVVNVGSELGVVGDTGGQVPYATSKGGVIQFTRCLAAEWASYGINVNCVAPALMNTPLTADLFKDERGIKAFLKKIPLGRLPLPSEVADIVLFFCSPLSNPVTGHIFLVDGGYTAV